MDLIALRSLAALLMAGLVHGSLLSIARLSGDRRPLVYPALVIVLASVLSWPALLPLPWLVPVTLAVLAGAAAVALKRTGRPRVARPRGLEWVALAILGIQALWSAFPDYRYDQWNYHLVVPKAVADGPLAPPILNDHVFFTGVYEYLFTLSRGLSSDDIFNQCFANAFTWLFWALAAWGLLDRLRRDVFPSAPSPLLLLAFVSFAIPDQVALLDAKPDIALLVAALALLVAWWSGRSGGVLVGFFLVAPLALKVTWLHFALAVTPVLLIDWWRGRASRPRPAALGPDLGPGLGLAVAAATVAPIAAKNLLFFGNPFHPAQLGPIRSSFWSERMAAYWHQVSGAAQSLPEYLAGLAQLPLSLSWSAFHFALPLLLLALPCLLLSPRPRVEWPPLPLASRRVVVSSAWGLASFLLLWPLLFRPLVYPRFVFAGFAFVVVLSVGVLDRELVRIAALVGPPRRTPAVALATALVLLPAALAGSLPGTLSRMGQWSLLDEGQFLIEGPPEWGMNRDLRSVNAHRRRVFPDATFGERVTLVDIAGTYLLDGASLGVGGREYEWHRAHPPPGTSAECLWEFLRRMDVTYIFTRQRLFDHWPREYHSSLPRLEPIDSTGRVLYADPDLVRQWTAEPGCPDEP